MHEFILIFIVLMNSNNCSSQTIEKKSDTVKYENEQILLKFAKVMNDLVRPIDSLRYGKQTRRCCKIFDK